MRITVRNLGVLKEASIDLKPLTIFIGPNNSGKTWLAYALASILGNYGSKQYIQAYIEKQIPNIYAQVNQAVEQVITEGNSTIDLYKFAKDYGEIYFNEVAKHARTWIDTCLGTQLTHFDNLSISITLEETKTQFLNQVYQYAQRVSIGPQGSLLTIRKQPNENKVYAFTSADTQDVVEPAELLEENIPDEEIRERLITFVSTAFQRSLCPGVFIFPTERTFLVTGRANTMTNRSVQYSSILPAPVNNFIKMIDIAFRYSTEAKRQRERIADNNIEIKQYIELAEILETQVLAGGIDFSTPEPNPSREILFQPSQEISLEVSTTSSMVKGLSSLVLYLRLFARPGMLLVIDEPEMNLHPEAQAKMIEFLAMLVNAGLNVLFTTHSPYITDHLTNLIKASMVDDKEAVKDAFFLKRTNAFISKEKVAVYGFGEGIAKDVLDEEGFIDLNTFGEVSDRVSNIYFTL